MKIRAALMSCLFTLSLPALGQPGDVADFVPEGFALFDTVYGDLNHDGIDDCVLIVKSTDPDAVIVHEYRGELDRNRRGIIVLRSSHGRYEPVVQNLDCFSSENEDGGVYYPPQLSVDVTKGNLYVSYEHGRYGYWSYIFRFQHNDLELIGYEGTEHYGPIVNGETRIFFANKCKWVSKNVNEATDEPGDEVYEETWHNIAIDELIKLSEIEDFYGLVLDWL